MNRCSSYEVSKAVANPKNSTFGNAVSMWADLR